MSEEDQYEDPAIRRNLRFEYRKLISDTEQNRHDLIQPESTGLYEALNKGDELFSKVRRTREAALDSQFLVLVSNLGREQSQHMQTGIVTFEPHTFAEKLITFMGGRHVSEHTDKDDNTQNVRFESLDWSKLGKIAVNSLRRTPTVEFMHGPVSMDTPVKKIRKIKQATGEKPGAAQKVTPKQLAKVENNNEEATTKEVQRVLEALERVTSQGDSEEVNPVSLFKFVTNPHSFSQTVENIFHLSFLINKGNACIKLDKNDLPMVYITAPYSAQAHGSNEVKKHQNVMPFTMADWKDAIRIFKIKKPMIPPRSGWMEKVASDGEDSDMEEEE